jgi:ribosome-associated protein
MPETPSTRPDTEAVLAAVVRALDEKKATDLRIFRVSEQSSITDYLVLATGTSEPHLRALRIETERILDARGAKISGMDTGEKGSGWIVVDAFQMMVHLFLADKREAYRLENLWKDAKEIPIAELLAPAPTPKPRRTRAKTSPATRKKAKVAPRRLKPSKAAARKPRARRPSPGPDQKA